MILVQLQVSYFYLLKLMTELPIVFLQFQTGYATLAIGAPWIFRSIQALISPMLCTCDVFLLLITGFGLKLPCIWHLFSACAYLLMSVMV